MSTRRKRDFEPVQLKHLKSPRKTVRAKPPNIGTHAARKLKRGSILP